MKGLNRNGCPSGPSWPAEEGQVLTLYDALGVRRLKEDARPPVPDRLPAPLHAWAGSLHGDALSDSRDEAISW